MLSGPPDHNEMSLFNYYIRFFKKDGMMGLLDGSAD